MTILTNLKALLFSGTALPRSDGAPSAGVAPQGDFAALFEGVAEARPAPPVAVPPAEGVGLPSPAGHGAPPTDATAGPASLAVESAAAPPSPSVAPFSHGTAALTDRAEQSPAAGRAASAVPLPDETAPAPVPDSIAHPRRPADPAIAMTAAPPGGTPSVQGEAAVWPLMGERMTGDSAPPAAAMARREEPPVAVSGHDRPPVVAPSSGAPSVPEQGASRPEKAAQDAPPVVVSERDARPLPAPVMRKDDRPDDGPPQGIADRAAPALTLSGDVPATPLDEAAKDDAPARPAFAHLPAAAGADRPDSGPRDAAPAEARGAFPPSPASTADAPAPAEDDEPRTGMKPATDQPAVPPPTAMAVPPPVIPESAPADSAVASPSRPAEPARPPASHDPFPAAAGADRQPIPDEASAPAVAAPLAQVPISPAPRPRATGPAPQPMPMPTPTPMAGRDREPEPATIAAPVPASPPEAPPANRPSPADRPGSAQPPLSQPPVSGEPLPIPPPGVAGMRPSAAAEGAAPPIVPGTADPVEPVAGEAPPADAKPVRAEALSLLQLVRDQLKGRESPSEAASPTRLPSAGRDGGLAPPDLTLSAMTGIGVDMPAAARPAPAAMTVPVPMLQPGAPADLSATLGDRVVDMGVSGQWIDGLARDIAGLSANGAQGRFQINADRLGPVQVDIRQGAEGASVSLTVATEAAETALRQDGDRLRLDAGLAAIRIADLRIERSPHIADAARADAAGQQSSSQNPSQHSGQNQADGGQANMGQSAGQDRWQARENFAAGRKDGADRAVLDPVDARDAAGNGPRRDFGRARYA